MEPENDKLAKALHAACKNIIATKSTSSLYEFKNVVEQCIEPNRPTILNRSTIIACLKELNLIVPSKLCANLLARAIALKDIDLCITVIDNVQILEENQAVDCLKYFLSDFEKKEVDEKILNLTVDSKTEQKLDLIFKKNFDYRLFTKELKQLSSVEFIICLLYLQNYLKNAFQNKSCLNEAEVKAPEPHNEDQRTRPNILQITDLFCCFLDAHFTHITLSSKAQEIIAEVLQLIETQLDVFMDFLSVESLIKEIKQNNGFRIKNENNFGHYYIEVLKI